MSFINRYFTDPIKSILSPRGISNLFLHVSFIATFIGVFFFTYASNVEKNVVEKQVGILVDDFTADIKLWAPEDITNQMEEDLKNMKIPDMSAADKEVADNNSKLFKKAAIILGIALAVSIFVTISLWLASKKSFSLKRLFAENIVILTFVGITEFIFLTFIGQNYRSADPNFVKKEIVKILSDYSKNG